MAKQKVFEMAFARVYPMYVQKAERKNRTKEEVDQIICWLTGYDQKGLDQQIEQGCDIDTSLLKPQLFIRTARLSRAFYAVFA